MMTSRACPKPTRSSILFLLSILLLGVPAIAGAERSESGDPPLPPGVEEDWWTTVREKIAAAEYHVTWRDELRPEGPTGSWQAPNRVHGFRTRFLEEGIRLAPRAGQEIDWEWGLDFIAWGREGTMRPAQRPILSPYEGRIDYDRGDFVEWYVNSREGLKQGFTILSAPGDAASGGPLRVEMAIAGTLRPDFAEDGQAIDFLAADGARVLHYAELVVTDARDRELPARMEGFAAEGSQGVRLVVDDRGAFYPVTIDPLATSAAWFQTGEEEWQFGASVASAGDVNGDGYGDVIVGAPGVWDGRGWAAVYFGSASGLSTTADWGEQGEIPDCVYPEHDGEDLGQWVGAAGDLNGDGYGDVVYVSSNYREVDPYDPCPDYFPIMLKRVAVHYGSAEGPSESADWVVIAEELGCGARFNGPSGDFNGDGYSDLVLGSEGEDACAWNGGPGGLTATPAWRYGIGFAVASAVGDVNGDGYADAVLGEPGYVNEGPESEGQALLFLGSSSGLAASPSWQTEGNQANCWYGGTVAPAGDVNGDGYSDVIVAAAAWDDSYVNEGRVFLYHGNSAGLQASPAWQADGDQEGAYLGTSVFTAGDVNGDGYSDVITGAREYSNGETGEGRAYVYYGSASGLTGPHWQAEGDQTYAHFGHSVSTAGDVDGDGYSDVIVATPYFDDAGQDNGAVWLYRGGPEGMGAVESWYSLGDQVDEQRGFSVASAGDVDADGHSDIIVGAPFHDNGQADEGAAFVFLGSSSGLSLTPDWTAESDQSGARLGWRVGSAGDVNGDGFSDVIVGAPYYHRLLSSNNGVALVWHGSAFDLGANGTLANADWRADGIQANSYFGYSVGTAGDVNGDGYGDVVIGAPYYDDGQTDEGGIFLWYGSASGLGSDGTAATADWRAHSDQSGARLGATAGTAGDVNADGYSDVVTGAYLYDDTYTNEGAGFAWHGSVTGMGPIGTPGNADWSVRGNQASAYFGFSIGTAGDVNGDGYADVVAGAHGYDGSYADEGRIFVYHGGPPGLEPLESAFFHGGQAGASLGYSVASAGDVNGDGYADVVAGAYLYDEGDTDNGKVWVWHGSASGLGVRQTPWTRWGPNDDSYFGRSVASAGDVDGDGYADVLIGVPGQNYGVSGQGAARLYTGFAYGVRTVAPQQRKIDDDVLWGYLIHKLGLSDSDSAFKVSAWGRGMLGRGEVKLEWEVKPVGVLFDGTGTQRSPAWTDSTTGYVVLKDPVYVGVGGAYHWRVRVRQRATTSPYQLWGRWLAQPWGGWNETDLRVQRDSDSDGWPDELDNCYEIPNAGQEDDDSDGVGNVCDNCVAVANPDQGDFDSDGPGDACDDCTDTDSDGFGDVGFPANVCADDNCPDDPNPGQEDSDSDGLGDVCDDCTDTDSDGFGNLGFPFNVCAHDNCPDDPNPGQEDLDSDGLGDVCDPDRDGDGTDDVVDCAFEDPLMWSIPSPALELLLSKEPLDNLGWTEPADPGAVDFHYDVLISPVAGDWSILEAICIESDETDLVATEVSQPLPGEVYHYLVRVENACGTNLGSDWTGTPRVGRLCP
jgi:hypothetical protein